LLIFDILWAWKPDKQKQATKTPKRKREHFSSSNKQQRRRTGGFFLPPFLASCFVFLDFPNFHHPLLQSKLYSKTVLEKTHPNATQTQTQHGNIISPS
jgi:hypothetical protein